MKKDNLQNKIAIEKPILNFNFNLPEGRQVNKNLDFKIVISNSLSDKIEEYQYYFLFYTLECILNTIIKK